MLRNRRVKCPYCAELIMPEALKCRYCGEGLPATAEHGGLADVVPTKVHVDPISPAATSGAPSEKPRLFNAAAGTDERLVEAAMEAMELRSHEELQSIVEAGAGDTWRREGVEAARRVLRQRPLDPEPPAAAEDDSACSLEGMAEPGRFVGHWAVTLLAVLWLGWTLLMVMRHPHSDSSSHYGPSPGLLTLLPAIGLLTRRNWGLCAVAVVSVLVAAVGAFSSGSYSPTTPLILLFFAGSFAIVVNRLICRGPARPHRMMSGLGWFTLSWLVLMAVWVLLGVYAPGALLRAAAVGDYQTASRLSLIPLLVNTCDDRNGTPLFQAARRGDRRMVELLIDRGADVNQGVPVPRRELATEMASRLGIDIMLPDAQKDEQLRKKGLDLDTDLAGASITALYAALESHRPSVVRLLLNKGARANDKQAFGTAPLHLAAGYGDIEEAALLLANGADINARSSASLTPLHCAAEMGRTKMVRFLLSRGADPALFDRNQNSALDYAVAGGHHDMVLLLRQRRARE